MIFIYSEFMYTLLDVIGIYLKNISKKKSKLGFFLPQSHIGRDSGFHAISGESRSDWDGWTVFFMLEKDKRTKYKYDVFTVDTT